MKKNKLSFLIISSVLAMSLAACNIEPPATESTKPVESSVTQVSSQNVISSNPVISSSKQDSSQAGASSSAVAPSSSSAGASSNAGVSSNGGASSNAGSSQGQASSEGQGSSQGGQGSSQGGQGSSQGGQQGSSQGQDSSQGGQSSSAGDNSSSGGQASSVDSSTSQPSVKTDWTDAEKATMSQYLHGLVLPFVNMDVQVVYSGYEGSYDSVSIISNDNMEEGFLRSYASIFEEDDTWVGGDISSQLDLYPGLAYSYRKKVTQGDNSYYVVVYFTGMEFDAGSESVNYSKTGKFVLEAMDPYLYEYPATFIGGWLSQVYSSSIVPPAFEAEFYDLDTEGVLLGYSETNIENAYKVAVETSGNFTLEPEKNAGGFYVAQANDGRYIMLFKYDSDNKMMILKVEALKGWNSAAINAIFAKNHISPIALPVIPGDKIDFSALEIEGADGISSLNISASKLSVELVQAFVSGLKNDLGYKVAVPNVVLDSGYYFTTFNVFTSEGMYTFYLTYSQQGQDDNLDITGRLQANTSVFVDWPTQLIARYLDADKDTAPAFVGTCYGFSASINQGGYYRVIVHVDEGSESAARDSYVKTLTIDNGYTANGTFMGQQAYLSQNKEISAAIVCDPTNMPGEISILLQHNTIIETQWPSDDIATAIEAFTSQDPITDTIPYLDVTDASECTVNDNFSDDQIEITIEGLASSKDEFVRMFKLDGWSEDLFYGYDTTIGWYGVLISPAHQLIAHFEIVGNDLVIYIKQYYEPSYAAWPSQAISHTLNNWGVKKDTLPSFDKAIVINQLGTAYLITVPQNLVQTAMNMYVDSLGRMGYSYKQDLGGYTSSNEELLVKVELDSYQGDYLIRVSMECIIPTYKIVGSFNSWNYDNSEITLVDATDAQEVADGLYESQLKATFEVSANDEFRVYDGSGNDNGWFGSEISENNSDFVKLDGGNIKALADGTVNLYFKRYSNGTRGIALEFSAAPVLVSWPKEAIDTILDGWNIDAVIPSIQNVSISEIDCKLSDSGKQFVVTLYDGADLLDDYNELLDDAFEYDDERYGYVYGENELLILTHADSDDLVITVKLVEPEPQPVVWPDDIDDILESWGVNDTIPTIEDASITDVRVEYDPDDDPNVFSIIVEGGKDLVNAYEEIVAESYRFDNGDNWWVSGSEELALNFSAVGDDLVIDVGLIKDDGLLDRWPEEQLAAYFNNGCEFFPYSAKTEAIYTIEYIDDYAVVNINVTGAEDAMSEAVQEILKEFGEGSEVYKYSYNEETGKLYSPLDGAPSYEFTLVDEDNFTVKVYFEEKEVVPQNTWAEAQAAIAEYYEAEGYQLPSFEIEGATSYVFDDSTPKLSITFEDGTNLEAKLDAIIAAIEQVSVEGKAYHYSALHTVFVNVKQDLIFELWIEDENTISIVFDSYDLSDEGFGLVIVSSDQDGMIADPHIGERVDDNEGFMQYFIGNLEFEEGTYFFIYDFSEEQDFNVVVNGYSLGGDGSNGAYLAYFEYDAEAGAFVVKQTFTANVYIQIKDGQDRIYIGFAN